MNELTPYTEQFRQIAGIVETAKERAYRKVNEELILMYREIGERISKQSENAAYGDAFIQKLADFFAENYPELKGFNRRGLYRMKQFYELYRGNEKVSTLLTQLSWSNHLKIMSACKTMEERMFYMNLCIKEKYSARERLNKSTADIMSDLCCLKSRNSRQLKNQNRRQEISFWTIMCLIFLTCPSRYPNMNCRNQLCAI